MKVPFVDLKIQYQNLKSEMDSAIQNILDTSSFIMGEPVTNFEKEFADFCGAKYCLGVSSGTSALQVAMQSAGIGPGDEVITVVNTFIATTEAITSVGATIKLVDCDKKTFNIDPKLVEKAITPNTKAILPVHLYGQSADMGPLIELAKKHNLIIIEDCAQAHGAEYEGKKVPVSDVGCFSFFPGKNLGAYGDGGAIVTNDKEIYLKAFMMRNHGRKPGEKYEHSSEGMNHRLDALQAAILSVKLKYLDDWTNSRRKNAALYDTLLSGLDITIPLEADYAKHVYHLYVIQLKKRDELQKFLKENEIDSGVHYPLPLHLQPAYKYLNLPKGAFPVSEKGSQEILSLPMFPELTEEQIRFVVGKIKEFLQK